ncbi:TPA: transposase [Vibrio parahaemolyticus]|nr:transposase [Vibrio parahaemolyticus]
MCYIDDGHLSIDNNCAELAIKPLVIGRKNGCSRTSQCERDALQYCRDCESKRSGPILLDAQLY